MRHLALALALGSIAFAQAAQAQPQVPSQQMTCSQAVATYQQYKRIYVLANGKDIVPLYGMTPKAEWQKLHCFGHRSVRSAYWVPTLDVQDCVIGWYCS